MRVVHIITSLDAGGAQQMLSRIVTNANDTGINEVEQIVVSLMSGGKYASSLKESNIEVHCLGLQRRHHSLKTLVRLSKILRSKEPDVVMTWLYHADLMGTVAALLAGISVRRVIWNLRCSNIDFARYARTTRVIVTALSWMSFLPGAVVVNSDNGRTHHLSLGYQPRKWIYLPNGLDISFWRPNWADRVNIRREFGLNEQNLLVGMVARVDPQKDHSTFLAAAEDVANTQENVRFLLVGDGAEELKLPRSLVDKVIVLGYRHDVEKLMRAMDIHVLSSAFGEGFPNVICEAMASGVPCVVTDVGQAAKIVEGTGISVPPGSPAKLAHAIRTLINEPTDSKKKRAKDSRDRVVREFDITHVRSAYLSVIADISNTQPAPASA